MKKFFLNTLLFFPLIFASCNFFNKTSIKPGVYFNEEEFNSQKSLYEQKTLDSYSFDYSYQRGDAYPENPDGHLIKTSDSSTTTFDQSNDQNITDDYYPDEDSVYYITSIEDLFEFVENRYKDELDFCNRYADRFRVEINVIYNSEYHFPEDIEIYPEEINTDEQPEGLSSTGITVKNFAAKN